MIETDLPFLYSSPDPRQGKHDPSVSWDSSFNSTGEGVMGRDSVFITGLPTNMSEKLLFDTLWDEFSTVGPIKVTKKDSSRE